MWTTTAAPNAQRHASTFTRPPKLALKRTQSTLVGRVGPTQNHANIVTQMCSADIATAAAAALMIVPLGAPEVHAACAQQPHRWSAVRAALTSHVDAGMGRHMGGHTCARTAFLAVQEGPPSPAVRPGPIRGMGTAVRCRAHSVTGTASATNNAADEHCPTSARTIFAWPVQADEAESARDADHDDMRSMRQRERKVKRAHLPGLMEMFERALRAG
jgi:hypothetical protein